MRILVTGATGFVGSVLLPELIARHGAESCSVYMLPGERIPESWARTGVSVFLGDVADSGAVWRAVSGHSHVVHLAGLISYWKRDAPRLMRTNRDGVRSVVEACLGHGIRRLVHVSSVGAIGFYSDGRLADETTPFNWPRSFYYMTSKREGQKIVEETAVKRGLQAVILNPASIMGPGDHNIATPHNQLYRMICLKRLFGSFSGGLAVVDVRDLVEIILKALEGGGKIGEPYLVVGANLPYADVVRMISRACGRKAYPFPIPTSLAVAAGGLIEAVSNLTKKRPLLTYAYGRLGGWRAYYDSTKSRREFGHKYIPLEQTIRDGWEYFQRTFCTRR
jgi:dihydroflavonol-4-reductase